MALQKICRFARILLERQSGWFGRMCVLWPGGCGLNTSRVIPKTLKMHYLLFCFALSIKKVEIELVNQCQYNVTWWNIMSCVLGMIFQWGSTLNTVVMWLKDCLKWRKTQIKQINKECLCINFVKFARICMSCLLGSLLFGSTKVFLGSCLTGTAA